MSNQRLSRDRARKCLLTALALALLAGLGLAPVVHAQAGLWTQTLQEHFAAGTLTDVDVNRSPGDVVLTFTENVDQAQTLENGDTDVYGLNYRGQTFRPAVSGPLSRIRLTVERTGNPATLIVEIRNVSGDVPGTTVYASEQVPPSSVVAGSFNVVNVVFSSPFDVVAGTDYAIVLRQEGDGGNDENYYSFRRRGQNAYARGEYCSTTTGEGGWATVGYDMWFQILVGEYALTGDLVSSRHDAGANLAN